MLQDGIRSFTVTTVQKTTLGQFGKRFHKLLVRQLKETQEYAASAVIQNIRTAHLQQVTTGLTGLKST